MRRASYEQVQYESEPPTPVEGEVHYEYGPPHGHPHHVPHPGPLPHDGFHPGPPCEHCGGHGDCDWCSDTHCDNCSTGQCRIPVCMIPCPWPDHFDIFGGVHGFKGVRDFGLNGNFGFQEGANASGGFFPFPHYALGYQLGFQALQSDLHGSVFESQSRQKYYVTAGLFHPVECGLKYGVVFDWQHDEILDEIDLTQIRAEIAIRNLHGREIGFWTAVHTNIDDGLGLATPTMIPADPAAALVATRYEGTDQFVFYYRWNFACGGHGRLWGGFSGSEDGIFGGDAEVPLNDRFSLSVAANYLATRENAGFAAGGPQNEQWNLAINVVWHLGRQARCENKNLFRPMFNVADNGTFFVERSE